MADDELPDDQQVDPVPPDAEQDDRRRQSRTKFEVKRTLLASLEAESADETSCHLHLLDISEGGMRINIDRTLEVETQIGLRFDLTTLSPSLNGQFDSVCRVVWTRPTPGGSVTGLEFKELRQDSEASLKCLLEIWSEKASLELTRLWKPINAKLRQSDEEPWSRTHFVQALSEAGFQFKSSESMEKDQVWQARLLLTGGPIAAAATVHWCKELSARSFEIALQFLELGQEDEASIRLHLKRTGNASFRK